MTAGTFKDILCLRVYRRLSNPPPFQLPNFNSCSHADHRYVFGDTGVLPEFDRNGDSPLPVKLALLGRGKEFPLCVASTCGEVVELKHSFDLRLPGFGREEVKTRLGALGQSSAFGREYSQFGWNRQSTFRIERVMKGPCKESHCLQLAPPVDSGR